MDKYSVQKLAPPLKDVSLFMKFQAFNFDFFYQYQSSRYKIFSLRHKLSGTFVALSIQSASPPIKPDPSELKYKSSAMNLGPELKRNTNAAGRKSCYNQWTVIRQQKQKLSTSLSSVHYFLDITHVYQTTTFPSLFFYFYFFFKFCLKNFITMEELILPSAQRPNFHRKLISNRFDS